MAKRGVINGKQCLAARGWLGLTQKELARLIGRKPITLRRFEAGKTELRDEALDQLRTILESRGVRFRFDRHGKPLGIEFPDQDGAHG